MPQIQGVKGEAVGFLLRVLGSAGDGASGAFPRPRAKQLSAIATAVVTEAQSSKEYRDPTQRELDCAAKAEAELEKVYGDIPFGLGNRPNLTQMHAVAVTRISDDVVRARLLDEIGKTKSLSAGAHAFGVRAHTLPTKPRDIEDDGLFHYGIIGPSGASDSGKPGSEAKRYLDETTGPEKPRVYRNSVILIAPSKDGLEVASASVRDYLAWEQVGVNLKEQQKDGSVDIARMQTLAINLDKAKGRIPDAIRQAYCTVVTISNKNEVQAFKINVTDEPHFTII